MDLERLRTRLGADHDGAISCPLPGHSGRAYIDVPPDDDGDLEEPRLLCCTGRPRSLGEMRAAIGYGFDKKRTNIELAVWTRRLAHDVGAFVPAEIRMPPLPADADASLRRASAGFALLVGLRWSDGPRRPVAWSVRFSAAWCGLSEWEARIATTALREAGVIVESGRVGRARLFLPATPSLRLVDGAGGPPIDGRTDSGDDDLGGWDEGDLVAAIIETFDAVEIADVPPQHTICASETHRGDGWRLASGGPWQCGMCHPPTTTERIVWESA